jgi:serine phosphatase RsbU (regulator of sigma subunit)
LRGLPLERLAENVIDAVVEYSGRPVPTDDLTVLALRFHPGD